jgi:hypothetical protein
MATTPVKPPVAQAPPPQRPAPPQQPPPKQAPPQQAAPPPQVQPMNVNIHGVAQGPQPNMAPVSKKRVSPGTEAEMAAGAEALKTYGDKTNAEMSYGKKMLERHAPEEAEDEEDDEQD